MTRRATLTAALLTLAMAACGDKDADSAGETADAGYCAETAELVYCEGDSNCAFDPAAIDCDVSCANLEAICAAGCSDEPGCADYSMSSCLTGCNYAKDQACPNVTFGCEAQEDTCAGLDSCKADYGA